MDRSAFTNPAGRLLRTPQGYWAFAPEKLPREVTLSRDLTYLLSESDRALGELAGMARMLPNPELLVAPLSQREAVLSSRIEGTQASVTDLALYEAAGAMAPRLPGDVREVQNYRRSMTFGLERMHTLPLSLRLVRELHARLLEGVRGQERTPGEFRTSQNWIGAPGCLLDDATYVPPHPSYLMECLGDWELFLHEDLRIPPIVKCALMHYQFEAIHPFLDGNGRVGRLLVALFLCTSGHLPAPVLYLSPFFERYRDTYYERLRSVSERSEWEEWLAFFARAVTVQCRDALMRSQRLMSLRDEYRRDLLRSKAPPSAQRLVDALFINPGTTLATAARELGVTAMSASRAIRSLCEHGILEEATGRQRDRVYVARAVVDAIETGIGLENDDGVAEPAIIVGASIR
jgi:cell filamentation protein, protein adenylyltransferase